MWQRLSEWWRARGQPRSLGPTSTIILMYHRIAKPPLDPCLLCVSPQRFAEQLEVLSSEYDVVPLSRCRESLHNRRTRKPRIVLTFDDGYADNLQHGKPVLERFGMPATVFVSSGFVGTEREFWWDELDRLLLQPGELPASLRLQVNGELREWELEGVAHYPPERQAQDLSWSLMDPNDPCPRHRIYRELVGVLYTMPLDERHALLEELRLQTDKPAGGRGSHLVMTRAQVRQLADGGLVEIGAHTLTHPVLSAQPVDLQREEIHESKRQLEELVEGPVRSFAYPFGTTAHYDANTLSLVKEAGFNCACSNFAGIVTPDADPFQLPRHMVFNWTGDEFARQLHQWCSPPTSSAAPEGIGASSVEPAP